MEINIGKKVISAEIKALDLLKKSISRDFSDAIEVLFKTKGKIIISGLGKSGHIATKISSTFSSSELIDKIIRQLKIITLFRFINAF